MSIAEKLQQLFKSYQAAFIDNNIDKVSQCYHLPCSLNTPEQITFLTSKEDCHKEFGAIFTQLNEGDVQSLNAQKATFSAMTDSLFIVCIDWEFIDSTGDVYADFAAIYHVIEQAGSLKIINVTSHDLECSLSLNETFSW